MYLWTESEDLACFYVV